MKSPKFSALILLLFKLINFQVTAQILHYNYKDVLSSEYKCDLLFVSLIESYENATELSTTHLPDKTDDDVHSIEFRHGSFGFTFPSIICEKFKNLKDIDMNKGFVNKLSEKIFENCTNLERLGLNVMVEETLWENFFKHNLKLRILKIFSFSLTTLSRGFLGSVSETLTDLELSIETDSFTFPSDFLRNLSNLRSLDLNIKNMTGLSPLFFEKSEKLEVLRMVDCNIQDLPKDIFKPLKNLQNLDISRNAIKKIHLDSFGFHPSLMVVDFSENTISSVDPRFYQLPSLLYVSIPENCSKAVLVEDNLNGTAIKKHSDKCTENYRPRY